MNVIDDLDVSNKWKCRFNLLQKVGADKLSHGMILKSDAYRSLTFRERLSVNSNFLAFLGSFFYYFFKRMHLKGFVLLSFSLLWVAILSCVEFFTGLVIPSITFWILSSVLCSQWANYDMYRKTFHNEILWSWVPEKYRNKSSVFKLLALSIIVWGGVVYYIFTHSYSTNAAYDDSKAFRVPCGSFVMFATQEEINLYGNEVICALKNN
jgi:hypothetical protein